MPLDKFISSVRSEVAKRFDLKTDAEIDAFFLGMEESAKDNQKALEKRDKMLRDTVAELCEAKRLLKAAIKDIGDMSRYCLGMCCDSCPQIHTLSRGHQSCIWQHEEAALKLIGETNDEP